MSFPGLPGLSRVLYSRGPPPPARVEKALKARAAPMVRGNSVGKLHKGPPWVTRRYGHGHGDEGEARGGEGTRGKGATRGRSVARRGGGAAHTRAPRKTASRRREGGQIFSFLLGKEMHGHGKGWGSVCVCGRGARGFCSSSSSLFFCLRF